MQYKSIEALVSGMLTTSQANKLNVKGIKDLATLVNKADIQRFTCSIHLGRELNAKADDIAAFLLACQNKAKDCGLKKPTMETIFTEVYEISKGWAYRLIKAGSHDEKLLPLYLSKAEACEKDGEKAEYSIEAFNTWAKEFPTHKGNAKPTKESISKMRKPENGGDGLQTIISVTYGKLTFKLQGLNGLPSDHDTNMNAQEIHEFVTMLNQYTKTKFSAQIGKAETEKLAKMLKDKVQPKAKPKAKPVAIA